MSNHPLVNLPRLRTSPKAREHNLMLELQSKGLRLVDPAVGAPSRRGGAGPSDHKALLVEGRPIMTPVHTSTATVSPFVALAPNDAGESTILKDGVPVGQVQFPGAPRFYGLKTADGIPYHQIATLHGADVLATTVLQTCIRYDKPHTACQFCAIGQSLAAKRTLAKKTPQQLAEVAKAAVELDGVKHMVMTTGTPNRVDRGAKVLAESAEAIRAAVDLPLQGQCEPPEDLGWFQTMKDAGIDTLGLHLEAVTPSVRSRIMPGKSQVSLETYMEAFETAVAIFGYGQVSSYILAGLGDSADDILHMSERLINLGVYPFVVPFVPISGTPMENHPAPNSAWLRSILMPLGQRLQEAGMTRETIKAGCGRCGACSSQSAFEGDAG